MKKIVLVFTILPAVLLSGCAVFPYQSGFLYTQQAVPLNVRDNNVACNKRGEATTTNYLGLIAMGDAGLEAAKHAGGITKVGTVDVHSTSILGLIDTTTTVVCGE